MNLQSIPKVELHRHFELSARHSTIKELAPQMGITLNKDTDFAENFLITEPMADLGSVLGRFLISQKLFLTEEMVERIAFEICEDAYLKEGVRILELRYAPTFMTSESKLSFEKNHDALMKGIRRAEEKYPIAVGVLLTIQRILPVSEAERVCEFALDKTDEVVGLDLADNEVGFDCKPFAKVFEKAKAAGLGITIHNGESNVPEAPQNVMDALQHLGADRIGHGVQIYKDEKVMDYVKSHNIPLELCLTSNWLVNAVPSIEAHPIRKLMEYGIQTTINSDDPSIFNTDLVQEYTLLAEKHNFTEEEFKKCNDYAFESSFINEEKKKAVWS